MEKARSTRCGGRLVRYGAKGAKVMPGTPKGDAYCARSLGQMRDHPEAAADPCSPLRLSRKRWACKGAVSMKKNPATSSSYTSEMIRVHNPESLIAPDPTPFGEVIFDDDSYEDIKDNATSRADVNVIAASALKLTMAQSSEADIARIRDAVVEFLGKPGLGVPWINSATKFVRWLDAGMPVSASKGFATANKVFDPANPKSVVFSIFGKGNSKLPYTTFSTLPGITCPGAGECLTKKGETEDDQRLHKGGWCYSFKAWRYPGAFFRQLGNTILISTPKGRATIARVMGLWAETLGRLPGGNTIRLYVDGDIQSKAVLDFWMNLCRTHSHINAYGYSKSWPIFLQYDKELARKGEDWPDNYTLNLSEGSAYFKFPEMLENMKKLKITREVFGTVDIKREDGSKIPQNFIDLPKDGREIHFRVDSLENRIKATSDGKARAALQSELNSLQNKQGGVYYAITRLKRKIAATTGDERERLEKKLVDWIRIAALLEATRGKVSEDEDEGSGEPKAYVEVTVIEDGVEKKKKRPISIPEEFWSRNPAYTEAVSEAARKKYPSTQYKRDDGTVGYQDKFFVCPGKCGNCLGAGRHACGDKRLELPIVIGLH